jgi:hypothetical protein
VDRTGAAAAGAQRRRAAGRAPFPPCFSSWLYTIRRYTCHGVRFCCADDGADRYSAHAAVDVERRTRRITAREHQRYVHARNVHRALRRLRGQGVRQALRRRILRRYASTAPQRHQGRTQCTSQPVGNNQRCQQTCLNRRRVCRFSGSVGFYPRAVRYILYSRTRISAQNAYQLLEHTPSRKETTQFCVVSFHLGVCSNN